MIMDIFQGHLALTDAPSTWRGLTHCILAFPQSFVIAALPDDNVFLQAAHKTHTTLYHSLTNLVTRAHAGRIIAQNHDVDAVVLMTRVR